jgi:hypothetical protein
MRRPSLLLVGGLFAMPFILGPVLAAAAAEGSERPEPNKPSSPLVLENEFLRISVDAQTGAILGIANRKTHTEYMARRQVAQAPLIVDAYSANQAVYFRDLFEKQSGGFSTFDPQVAAGAKGDLVHLREPLQAGVQVTTERTNAFSRITCAYRLPGGIVATYSLTVRSNSPSTEWRAWVENQGGEMPSDDRRVYRVAFPVLEGLRLGEQHESNNLARPYAQGELVPDPSAYEFLRPKHKVPIYVLTYPGWASMSWQDLYAPGLGGLYLASYDLSFQQMDLESWPDKSAGTLTLDCRTLAFLEPGQSWTSQLFEVAVHEEDWHWGADHYREWARGHHRPYTGPDWVRKECDGWLGTGVPTRSYRDYLAMFEDARWLGLDYLQIWSEMLENVGPNKSRKPYYCFLWPDPERGGEAELTRTVREIRAKGGHIGFYHNLWTWDSELAKGLEQWRDQLPPDVHVPDWWGEARRWASVFPDGSREAGNFTHGYSGMCPAARGYQDYVLSWVLDRYIKRYGVDTWYFDSMPVTMFAAARICFSGEHGPIQPHGVGRGMLPLLERLHDGALPLVNLAVTSETVNDALMQLNSHALGLELIEGVTRYPHPEIYTYTFPEHAIFSGTCNGAGSGLHYYYPELETPRREDTMNRVFLMGYRFDILASQINRNDSFYNYLHGLIALRQAVKADLYASDFRDDLGLGPLPERVYAKLFRHRHGQSLTVNLVDRRPFPKAPFDLIIDLAKNNFTLPSRCTLYEFGGGQMPLSSTNQHGRLSVPVPSLNAETAAILISRAK